LRIGDVQNGGRRHRRTGRKRKGLPRGQYAESLDVTQRKANVTVMRVEGGVDMLEQQQRRWPDWCEDQHS
jgi:hypothetical protein